MSEEIDLTKKSLNLRLENCDVGITLRGTEYSFEDVTSVNIATNKKVHRTKGINSVSKKGLKYVEGISQATTISFSLVGIDFDLANLMNEVFDNEEDVSAYIIERNGGKNIIINNASIQAPITQENIAEGSENLTINVVLESFDVKSGKGNN